MKNYLFNIWFVVIHFSPMQKLAKLVRNVLIYAVIIFIYCQKPINNSTSRRQKKVFWCYYWHYAIDGWRFCEWDKRKLENSLDVLLRESGGVSFEGSELMSRCREQKRFISQFVLHFLAHLKFNLKRSNFSRRVRQRVIIKVAIEILWDSIYARKMLQNNINKSQSFTADLYHLWGILIA